MYTKYAEELKDLGMKEANPPLPKNEVPKPDSAFRAPSKRAGFLVTNPFAPRKSVFTKSLG